jgi:hypothetical protein
LLPARQLTARLARISASKLRAIRFAKKVYGERYFDRSGIAFL